MSKSIKTFNQDSKLKENYIKILYLLSPILPHFASECLEDLGIKNENLWPIVNKKYLKDSSIEIVIQINGKKRATINANKGISESEVIVQAQESLYFKKNYNNKKIEKSIYVKDRLLNLIIK
jgi:leucyl-tRNA synthetase